MTSITLPILPLFLVLAAAISLPAPASAEPGDTELVSVRYGPRPPDSFTNLYDVSGDGRYVLFVTDSSTALPSGQTGLLMRDRLAGTTFLVSVTTAGQPFWGHSASMSSDGRYVVSVSTDPAVVPGDTNNATDIFLRDVQAGTTELVSVSSSGQQYDYVSSPSVSDDGRYVAFGGSAAIYIRDRLTRQTTERAVPGLGGGPLLSADGRWVFYENWSRLIALDRVTGQTELINVTPTGRLANDPAYLEDVSADGRYVLFTSGATDLVYGPAIGGSQGYIRDRVARTTQRATIDEQGTAYPNASYMDPRLSADGRCLTFIAGLRVINQILTYDVIWRDRWTNMNAIASVSSSGLPANGANYYPQISGDGRFVAFFSEANNLAPSDTDRLSDVYIHEFAVTSVPQLVLAPTSLKFGGVPVGTVSAIQVVQVRSTGTTALQIKWIGLTGTNAGDFARTRKCPGTLSPGATCITEVAFTPTSIGWKTARLVVSTVEGVRKSVALSGTGQ